MNNYSGVIHLATYLKTSKFFKKLKFFLKKHVGSLVEQVETYPVTDGVTICVRGSKYYISVDEIGYTRL